jgi:hypothetical protein
MRYIAAVAIAIVFALAVFFIVHEPNTQDKKPFKKEDEDD